MSSHLFLFSCHPHPKPSPCMPHYVDKLPLWPWSCLLPAAVSPSRVPKFFMAPAVPEHRAWCSKQFWMGSSPKALFLRRLCWKAPNGKPAELEETNQSCACSVLPEFGWFGLSPDLWFPNLRLCASRFPRIAFWCPGIIPKKFPIVSVLRKPWGTASPMGAGKADLLLTRVGNRTAGSLPPLTDSCLVWLAEL